MERVLVTGGAGYLGSVLVPELLRRGYEVCVLDDFRYGQTSLLGCCGHPALRLVRGDCRDRELMMAELKKADWIIPLAAIVGAPACDHDVRGAKEINQGAVELILEVRQPSQRILFPNTNSGYGIGAQDDMCDEESPLQPISHYGRTKVAAESAIRKDGNWLCFRLATVFGASPRMRVDLLVNDFVRRALVDRTIVVFEGHFRRNFIHIQDVAAAFLYGMSEFDTMKEQVYNVGRDDANMTKRELCAKIEAHVPGLTVIESETGRDPDKRDYLVSNAKIASAGFSTSRSIDDGIRELMKAYSMLDLQRGYSNIV
jgi:nucleoside-diphosphate-sugar epimerase